MRVARAHGKTGPVFGGSGVPAPKRRLQVPARTVGRRRRGPHQDLLPGS